MSDKKELLLAAIKKYCVNIAPEGEEFTLSSGNKSKWYLTGRNITFRGDMQDIIAHCILESISGTEAETFDCVGGLELGAVPVALSVAHASGKNAFAVRKQPKEHGDTGSLFAGSINPDDKVLIVEDTNTTGSSSMKAIDAVLKNGNSIVGVVCLVDRGGFMEKKMADLGLNYFSILQAKDFGMKSDNEYWNS